MHPHVATSPFPLESNRIDISDALPFGLVSQVPSKKLTQSALNTLNAISAIRTDLVLTMIETRTVQDFGTARKKAAPLYFRAVRVLSDTVHIIIPESDRKGIVAETYAELEGGLRDKGLSRFGAAVRDQAIFTVWTMRKISELVASGISGKSLPDNLKDKDIEFASNFSATVLWAHFHMECLTTAIWRDKTIYPPVLPEIIDGLRAAVDAYGWLRQGVSLRVGAEEPYLETPEWDDEDQALLEESISDLAASET